MSRFLQALGACVWVCAAAIAQADGRDAVAEATFGLDRFLAGGAARVAKPVSGDLIAAGGDVDIDAAVSGDAIVMGGNVRVNAEVGNGIYGAGGQLTINAPVGRNVRIAGGRIELGPNAKVAGNVTVAGGAIRMKGEVKGYAQVAGGRLFIDGPVGGDVVATTGELELGPNARIGGKLRHTADELRRDPAAQVAGGIERFGRPRKDAWTESRRSMGGGWFWTAGLMVLAAIFAGALPAASARVAGSLRARPWLGLLLGFIAFVCIPAAAVILAITIVGIPVALLALLLYFALLLLGYVATAIGLGDLALNRLKADAAARTGWRILGAVLAVLLLALLARIPYLGGLVILAAVLFGMGAIALSVFVPSASSRPGTPRDSTPGAPPSPEGAPSPG